MEKSENPEAPGPEQAWVPQFSSHEENVRKASPLGILYNALIINWGSWGGVGRVPGLF